MKTKTIKTNIGSVNISNEKLLQFIKLFEWKIGRKLTESEALPQAETLLRTISILYKPVDRFNYCVALISKINLKTKKV